MNFCTGCLLDEWFVGVPLAGALLGPGRFGQQVGTVTRRVRGGQPRPLLPQSRSAPVAWHSTWPLRQPPEENAASIRPETILSLSPALMLIRAGMSASRVTIPGMDTLFQRGVMVGSRSQLGRLA